MTAIFYFTKKEETRPMVSNRLNTIARVYDNIDLKCKIICPFKISAFAGMTKMGPKRLFANPSFLVLEILEKLCVLSVLCGE